MKVKAVWQFFEAERDGNSIHLFAPGGAQSDPYIPFRPPASRRWPVSERLHPGCRGRPPRSSGAVRGHCGCRRSRGIRAGQAGRRVFQGARAAGAGDRNRRRMRRMAASPIARGLGLSRSAHHDHAGALHFALPRQALQLRLSGVPEPGRPAGHLETASVPKRSASS